MVLRALEHLVGSRRSTEHHGVAEGDAPRVLHRTGVELRHEHLVVLTEGVPDAEQCVVVVEARAGGLDQVRRLLPQVWLERAPCVHPQRDAVVLGVHGGPGAGADRDEVGRQRRRLGELGATGPNERGAAVAEHGPVGRGGDDHRVGRLEVGLVEAGEDRRGGVEEEVAVDVVLTVGGIRAAVQALAVVAVAHRGVDLEHVVDGEVVEGEPAPLHGCRVEHPAVEGRRVQGAGPHVDERRPPRGGAAEPDRGVRAEHLAPAVEVQVDVHGVDGDQGGPGGGLGAGEGRHPPSQPERRAGQ